MKGFAKAENRNDPGSRLIALPVTRVLSTGSRPTPPIFWLTGGPGASNMKLSPFEEVLENQDIEITMRGRGAQI